MVFESYGKYYDIMYMDKDYEGECEFIESILRRYSKIKSKSILDIGCGTGNHAVILAKKGYRVVGFDISKTMIELAKKKSKSVEFYVSDIENFKFDKKFDACISMFAVISYITSTNSLLKAFKNIRDHLNPDGIFIFDVWNGLAVLRLLPEKRTKIIEENGLKIIRTVEPQLDSFNHICKVNYNIFVIKDKNVVDEFKETHVVRYYFPQEIKYYLEDAGFEVLNICPFMDLNGKVDENIWNMCLVARCK